MVILSKLIYVTYFFFLKFLFYPFFLKKILIIESILKTIVFMFFLRNNGLFD